MAGTYTIPDKPQSPTKGTKQIQPAQEKETKKDDPDIRSTHPARTSQHYPQLYFSIQHRE